MLKRGAMLKLIYASDDWYMDQNGYLCSCKDITDPKSPLRLVEKLDVELFSALKSEFIVALDRFSIEADSGLYVLRGHRPPIHVTPLEDDNDSDDFHPFPGFIKPNYLNH